MARKMMVCRLSDLEVTGAKGITLEVEDRIREIVVVLGTDGAVRAYENRCPHLESTLETWPDRFLDEARAHLVCTMHQARFKVDDGVCVSGPCEGKRLTPLAIDIADDAVMLRLD